MHARHKRQPGGLLAATEDLLPRAARVLAEATGARAAKLCHAGAGAQGRR